MKLREAFLGSALGVVLLAACGDVYVDPGGPIGVSIDGGVVDSSTPTVFPNDTPNDCPSRRPRENTSCSTTGSTCEYGSSPDRECNSILACDGVNGQGVWTNRPTDTCFTSDTTVCPVSGDVAALDGRPCSFDSDGGAVDDADEAVCNLTDGVCACTTGPGGASRHERKWVCVRPLAVCPPNRPLLGARCSGTLYCDYGSCAFKRGMLMECTENVWLTGGASCR
jgi:hypothetical protein